MQVKFAETDVEIDRCFPVMVQLRPHLDPEAFVEQVKRQRREGYVLVFVEDGGEVKSLAGFRIMEMLFHGRFLYVDDLVTDSDERSKGYGDALFDWLVDYAKAQRCPHLELDSGVHRFSAHRFYFRKRMQIDSFHFSIQLQ